MGTNNTKQAAWVALGSIFSYGFTLVSSMILSRFFAKGDYGTYQQVLYVYHTLLLVFTLGLPKAYSYFLPRVKNVEAKDVINKITTLFFALGAIFSLTIFFGSSVIAKFLNNPELTRALKIFALVPFLMLPTMGVEGILATYKKTKFVAIYTATTRSVMLLFVTLPVVIWGGGYKEALVGFTLSSAVAFVLALYLKYLPVKNESKQKSEISYSLIFKFSLPLLFASLWGILINSTDQFFISHYFGKEIFAEFSNGAIELPFATLIISATSTVLLPYFSKQVSSGVDKKEIISTWLSVFIKSAMLIYPIVIYCIFDARLIMSALYGEIYVASGDYFVIKVVTNFLKVIPYAAILIAIGSVKYYAKMQMLIFLLLVPTEWILIKVFNNPLVVTVVHTFYVILLAFIFIFHLSKHLKQTIKNMIPYKRLLQIVLASLISLVFTWLSNRIFPSIENKYYIITMHIFVFSIGYLLMAKAFKIRYLDIVKPLLQRSYE